MLGDLLRESRLADPGRAGEQHAQRPAACQQLGRELELSIATGQRPDHGLSVPVCAPGM